MHQAGFKIKRIILGTYSKPQPELFVTTGLTPQTYRMVSRPITSGSSILETVQEPWAQNVKQVRYLNKEYLMRAPSNMMKQIKNRESLLETLFNTYTPVQYVPYEFDIFYEIEKDSSSPEQ